MEVAESLALPGEGFSLSSEDVQMTVQVLEKLCKDDQHLLESYMEDLICYQFAHRIQTKIAPDFHAILRRASDSPDSRGLISHVHTAFDGIKTEIQGFTAVIGESHRDSVARCLRVSMFDNVSDVTFQVMRKFYAAALVCFQPAAVKKGAAPAEDGLCVGCSSTGECQCGELLALVRLVNEIL